MIGETEHKRDGLLPCVFCAARAAVLVVQQIDGVPELDDVCFVRCTYCYAQGPATDDEDKAVIRWNRRVQMDDVVIEISRINLEQLIQLLLSLKSPMVPYKMDPLAFCREAHRVKDKLSDEALALLPQDLVEQVRG